jgi:hypothetical protein
MKTWTTSLATIKEKEFNFDLHVFEVTNKKGKVLGVIYPMDLEDMESIINALNSGECPVADLWEDGNGNAIR